MNIFQALKQKFKTVVSNPKSILEKVIYYMLPLLGEKLYLKLLFRIKVGYKLDLNQPQTYNEKLNWLKLYYRKPELSNLVDKYEVKKIVADKIGEEYIIPTYGIWDSFDKIDFDILPSQFVLKTTHDSGGVVICKDKNKFDYIAAKRKLEFHQKKNKAYLINREWIYKKVKPRIIAEKYMIDSKLEELIDFKFFCFNGEVKALFVATDRQKEGEEVKFDYFDADFNLLDLRQKHPNSLKKIPKPKTFDLMKQKAKMLSEGYPHIRVDFYEIDGHLFFGELTFFHHGGLVPFYPKRWDYIFGNYINLPEKNT